MQIRIVCILLIVTIAANAQHKRESIPTTILHNGDLLAVFKDNSKSPKPELSGVQSLFNARYEPNFDAFDPDSPGSSAGLNFEHIISGHESPHNAFTPRHGTYSLYRTGLNSVRLKRETADSPWAVESVMNYAISEPHAIDFDFRCKANDADKFGKRNYAVFFWANYMNEVEDVALHFRGVDEPDGEEKWIRAEAPEGQHPDWRGGGTYRHASVENDLEYDDDVQFRLNHWSYNYPRFTQPFYYGKAANGMCYILMFDRTANQRDQIRFSLFKFKVRPGHQRPAWDFQYVINNVETGEPYGYRARAVWKKFVSPEDCLKEYRTWKASLDDKDKER